MMTEELRAQVARDPEELLSLEAAADLLCVSKSTLYRMLERGEIKGRKVGRQWRFRLGNLQAYLERGPQAVVLSTVREDEVDALLPSLAEAARRAGVTPPVLAADTSGEEKVARYVQQLLQLAIVAKASDIHLVPERDTTAACLRVDGVLQEIGRIPASTYPAVVGNIKQLGGMNLEERNIPQDGRAHFQEAGGQFDMRINVLPTVYGESIVMRLLAQSDIFIGLERLCFSEEDFGRYRRWLRSPCGLMLVAGPTGSGKTTTLYSGLLSIVGAQINTLTVEDPVEYALPHTRQVGVNRRTGLSFAVALRAFLRHDPDVIMVGEIRDFEVANIAVQAALTGHLVLSTLHTNDAASAALRLTEMGVEPFLVSGSLLGVISQRLARRICPDCREAVEIPAATREHIRTLSEHGGYLLPEDATFYQGAGCERCAGRRSFGRVGLYELLEFTPRVREAFLRGADAEALTRAAVADGMQTLLADGMRKAVAGIITVDEVLRVCAMG
ncbi:MAG TPA: GspE/PulE family protein [Armatimonadota bacterium]|jgi:excisionase family DNA binding protein